MQSLLKSFYKDNADAAFLGSSDGKIYAANLTAQILFTMSEADLLRTNFSELVDPTDQRLRVFLEERSAKGTHRGRLRMQTGKGRTFEAEVTSWFADQDKVWFSVKDITDQIEEQEQLQIRELHLRQMAESIREVFWVMDPDQMLYISPAYEDVFGRPTAEFYQRPDAFIDVIHPDDRERIRSAFKEHFTTGFFQDEYRIVRTDGSIRWIFSRGFPVEQKGIFYRTAGIAEDITERKDLENVLRFQSQIVQQVHDSVIATDCEGKITFWNNGAERLFGYSTEEAIGQNVSFLIVDAAAVPRILETLLTKQWLDLDILLKRRSGETFTGFLSLSILKNTEGVPIGTIGYTQDISARKTAEIRLQENEEKFRKTFRSSPDVMTLTTFREGRFLDVNQTFCEVTGYSREEALGRTAVELDIWVDSSHRDLLISRLQERGRVKNQLTIFRTKSGEERHFLVSAERIEIGGVESIILGAKDISERVHMEDALKEAKELLEVKVKERTFELEKANNAKDTFLANMSHEMRTPLSGILGMAELSLDQHVPDEVHDNLEMIRYSAKALSTIIDDLLDFSAIQFQRLAIKSIEVLLRDELEKMLGGFEEQAKSKGLFFSVTIQDDVPRRIISDPDRVRQIIINFLNNAIKFTQKGGIHLDVRRTAPDHLAFSVSDTGIGFPPDRISDIFESFTQLDATITKRFGGTGLGLAVSKNLAELMGGTIEVESEEGKGSVFTLIIPVEVPQEMKRVELPPAFDLTELRPLRILLAEDNPVNQTVIRKFLTKQGHTTTVVVDGRQVLDELKNKEFDLVLMDVQMPNMDGIEATRNIRSGISGVNSAEIPVIALTAYAMKGDREKFLRAGMDGYVSKPVDFKELAKAIFDAIGSTVDEQEKIES